MSTRSFINSSVVVAVLCVIGWVGSTVVLAAPAKKGTISGRIVGLDDKPVGGLALRLEKFQPIGVGGPGERLSTGMLGGMLGRTIIGRATTDKDGNFTFTNVEAGSATLVGGSNKMGWAYHDVAIEPDKETKIGDIKLVKTD